MHRAIRYGTLVGALLLAGCEQSTAPAESTFIPRPKYVAAQAVSDSLNSVRLAGYTWDPEAFFLSFVECTQKCVPPIPAIPPFVLGNNPLFLRSVVRGAEVTLLDRSGSAGALATVPTDPLGMWVMPKIPARQEFYYPRTTGSGALPAEPIFPVLTPLPPANYLPTVSLRPVATDDSDGCFGIETSMISEAGIMEAVAKYLTNKGTSTAAADFVNPAKYAGVTVFWLGNPGFPSLRAPAANTTVEATAGQIINVQWAPPGLLPPEAQATRGFFVQEGAPVSAVGITVILHPADSASGTVTYTIRDPQTDAATGRPWHYPAVQLAPMPGVITYGGLQLYFEKASPPKNPDRTWCAPRG